MSNKYNFDDLINIMTTLRSEDGCPWDKEQTHESLKQYLIEETYEVLEAIDLKDKGKIAEELGDVMLQVVFHSQIAKEKGAFDIETVIDGICRKMVNRHPHVFGDATCSTPDDVSVIWDEIKKDEKQVHSTSEILKDVPSNLPALMRAYKVQKKAAKVGFDWDDIEDVYSKVEEELQEVKEANEQLRAATSTDLTLLQDHVSEELGDLLFAVVNLSRFVDAQPELALTSTTEKFISRFEAMESIALKEGTDFSEMSLVEMDALWDRAKKIEREI